MAARLRDRGLAVLGLVALAVLGSGCSALASLPGGSAFEGDPPRQSLVFIIHGDGQYVYQDEHGETVRADEVTLEKAKEVGRQNPDAEVMIFHEQPRRRAFFFFTRPDGRFYYFRGGEEQYADSYRRSGRSRLAPVVSRVAHFDAGADVRMLFYFGHEVQEFGGRGYDATYPDRTFNLDDLTRAIKGVADAVGTLDLITLSTCYGGTPHTVSTLSPFTRYVLASPDNLHLSYLDLDVLSDLDAVPTASSEIGAFADTLARRSFERLTASLQTTVSLAVYDTERSRPYLDRVGTHYRDRLSAVSGRKDAVLEHYDCARDEAFVDDAMSDGVQLYYRAARFGRGQFNADHSGWMCWRLAE